MQVVCKFLHFDSQDEMIFSMYSEWNRDALTMLTRCRPRRRDGVEKCDVSQSRCALPKCLMRAHNLKLNL
jgi:hypothetical protein